MPAFSIFMFAGSNRLLTLSGLDILIIAIYFVAVLGIGIYLKKYTRTGE